MRCCGDRFLVGDVFVNGSRSGCRWPAGTRLCRTRPTVENDPEHGYLLDNRKTEAGVRFGALSELFDPVTFRHVDALGIGAGMRCWEVGAGGPSVPRGLAERVGPGGAVVATDIDVSWTQDVAGDVIEVPAHDVAADPPPGGGFDLVHARLVLVRVTGRAGWSGRHGPVADCSWRMPVLGCDRCGVRTSPVPNSGSPTASGPVPGP